MIAKRQSHGDVQDAVLDELRTESDEAEPDVEALDGGLRMEQRDLSPPALAAANAASTSSCPTLAPRAAGNTAMRSILAVRPRSSQRTRSVPTGSPFRSARR